MHFECIFDRETRTCARTSQRSMLPSANPTVRILWLIGWNATQNVLLSGMVWLRVPWIVKRCTPFSSVVTAMKWLDEAHFRGRRTTIALILPAPDGESQRCRLTVRTPRVDAVGAWLTNQSKSKNSVRFRIKYKLHASLYLGGK